VKKTKSAKRQRLVAHWATSKGSEAQEAKKAEDLAHLWYSLLSIEASAKRMRRILFPKEEA